MIKYGNAVSNIRVIHAEYHKEVC